MSHKIKENMEELQAEIKKLCEAPITYRSAEQLITCHKAYKIMCEMYGSRAHAQERRRDDVYKVDVAVVDGPISPFDRQMAMAWGNGLVNADGARGPHWTMEQINKVMQDYKVDCDPAEFWAVMNSLYSDYCEVLKKVNATVDTYVGLAKAWIDDPDAVPDKAAAYYTHIVKH